MSGTARGERHRAAHGGCRVAGSSPVSGTGTWNVVLDAHRRHAHLHGPHDRRRRQPERDDDAARSGSTPAMPDTTITSGPSGTTNDTTPTWTFSSSEAGSTFECALDGARTTASCPTPFTPTSRRPAHVQRARGRRRRQPRQHARHADDRRSTRRADRDDHRGPRARERHHADLHVLRPRTARRSSAAWTPRPSRPAPPRTRLTRSTDGLAHVRGPRDRRRRQPDRRRRRGRSRSTPACRTRRSSDADERTGSRDRQRHGLGHR